MPDALPIKQPFSFDQTVAFIRRFPPCQGETIIEEDALTAAVTIDGRAVPFTIRRRGGALEVETPRKVDAKAAKARAAHWIGADDDLGELYAAARGDDAFGALVERLHGLHHVRFLTLEEISVYCVMMQRTPIAMASRMKRAFLQAFGTPVRWGEDVARDAVAVRARRARRLDHRPSYGMRARERLSRTSCAASPRSARRPFATLPTPSARSAPRDPGDRTVLGGCHPASRARRRARVPSVRMFAADAARIYGHAIDEAAIAKRYGRRIGYWSFYVKTGAARLRD